MAADKDKSSADKTLSEKPRRRIPGQAKGKVWIAPDFDDPLPENVVDEFEKVSGGLSFFRNNS